MEINEVRRQLSQEIRSYRSTMRKRPNLTNLCLQSISAIRSLAWRFPKDIELCECGHEKKMHYPGLIQMSVAPVPYSRLIRTCHGEECRCSGYESIPNIDDHLNALAKFIPEPSDFIYDTEHPLASRDIARLIGRL